MILKDVYTVPLKPPMLKILYASTAFNQTVVVVRMDKSSELESIVHLDRQGNILFQKQYKDIIDIFGMMNEKEVIVCNVPQSKIDIINLETKTIEQINFQYLFEDTASIYIHCFSETNLFCIVQYGGLNDHRLKLSYFNFSNLKPDSVPTAVYESQDNEWTYEHAIQKMNSHSKIGWWTYKHEKDITFTYFDLRSNPQGQLSVVTTKSALSQQYGVDLNISISYLWQIRPDVYMLQAITNKFEHKEKCQNKNGILNNIYILDATIDKSQATLKETKFDFGKNEDGFCWNDQLTDCFGIGNVSVFHTFRHRDGKVLTTPVFYVNNLTEEIVYIDKWESICYQARYFFPGWDSCTVVQVKHLNADCADIEFKVQKAVDPKDISLTFLLKLNQDFEDDLLMDAIELLEKEI